MVNLTDVIAPSFMLYIGIYKMENIHITTYMAVVARLNRLC